MAMSPWPVFEEDEIEAVRAVLASGKVNYWTGGECTAFEREYAEYVGRRHAISLANGTLALELALRALGIGPGDEVIVPARTFIATASCVVAVGATPVVADVDPEGQGLDAACVRPLLSARSKAIIPVHLGGWPCDMDALMALARERNLFVIEDCAQAHGATWRGRPVGQFGDCAAFSFCQDKIITTGGEGGMLLLEDESVWRRAWAYKDHGKSYEAVFERKHAPGFKWLHDSFGSNYRMTEMQAAIGRRQLKKLDGWVAGRRRNAERLANSLARVGGLRIPLPQTHVGHAYYRLYAFIEPDAVSPDWSLSRIVEAIAQEGTPSSVGTCSEIYREQAFAHAGFASDRVLPVARRLGETSLAFLLHPTLKDAELDATAAAVNKVMLSACRR